MEIIQEITSRNAVRTSDGAEALNIRTGDRDQLGATSNSVVRHAGPFAGRIRDI